MFNNIGKKIKVLAAVTAVLLAIAAIITGIVLCNDNSEEAGIPILIFGPIVSWISSFMLYGFGELIDKVCDIEDMLNRSENKSYVQKKYNENRDEKLERLRSQGLITEEEYKEAISER